MSNLWHKTCKESVRSRPVTDDISVDLVIVGGGYTGASAALSAAKSGAKVCLLEAHTIGHGGSGRNVGLVNAGLWLKPDQVEKTLGPEAGANLNTFLSGAPKRVFDLIEEHSIDCDPVNAGTLHCAHTPRAMKELQARYEQSAKRGAPVRLLDAASAQILTGSKQVHGALHDARAGTIQPLSYCVGLARAAAEAGARISENALVDKITHRNGVWRVKTGANTVSAKHLLIATNAYHRPFLGTKEQATVPLHYFQFATVPLSDAQRAQILPQEHGCWDTAKVMSSFRLDADGRLIVGGMGNLNFAGWYSHNGWAERKLAQLYPQLAGTPLEHAWCGRIAMTGDKLPRIVRIGTNALSIFGYSGRGIGPGTVFGEAAAKALLDGDESLLPLTPVVNHQETLPELQGLVYEAAAWGKHLVSGWR